MTYCAKKLLGIVSTLLACVVLVCAGPAYAVVIEPDPDLHLVMGDLYAISVAMRLFYDDTQKTRCPIPDELSHYLQNQLPDNWSSDYRTAAIQGDWWVARKVPEFSTARKFLRENASLLGLYEQDCQSAWLGGAFVWMSAVPFNGKAKSVPVPGKPVFRAAQGEGDDRQHLFFNSPGTDYYWKSSLIYTTEAHAETLKKFGADAKGPFVTPSQPSRAPETLSASPVETPPDFTLSGEGGEYDVSVGDVIFSPIPRRQDN